MNAPIPINCDTSRVCIKLTGNCAELPTPFTMPIYRYGGCMLTLIIFDEVLADGTACFFPPAELLAAPRGRYYGVISTDKCCLKQDFEIGTVCTVAEVQTNDKEGCESCS